MYLPMILPSEEPLYIQLYQAIREDCLRGLLVTGSKLPSRRFLARELCVSINTVDSAYQQLVSEGYAEARPRSGYFVLPLYTDNSHSTHTLVSGENQHERCSPGAHVYTKIQSSHPKMIDFSPNGVDLSALPMASLRKLYRETFALAPEALFANCEPAGAQILRNAICRYLGESRGVSCAPDQIIIGAGTDYILQYLLQLLQITGHAGSIAMENPVYNKAFQIFSGRNNKVSLIPLDESGIDMHALRDSSANAVYVTPSHQFPLGIIMPVGRRAELLAWANTGEGRYIIEDDYDSEFRYSGRPIPPLYGMSGSDKVIYLGTFSKSIAPALRVSYLVLPHHLSKICRLRLSHFNTTVSMPDQIVLARFLESGLFARHINRMRTLYRRKRDHFLRELSPYRESLEISGTDAGLHLVCRVQQTLSEMDLVRLAAGSGIIVYGISGYYLKTPTMQGSGKNAPNQNLPENSPESGIRSISTIPGSTVLLGYGALSPTDISQGVQSLSAAWHL